MSESCCYLIEDQNKIFINIKKIFKESKIIIIETKSDIINSKSKNIKISNKTGEGIDFLKTEIIKNLFD